MKEINTEYQYVLPERFEELHKFHKSHVTVRNHEVLESLHSSFNTAVPATAAPRAKSKRDCCNLVILHILKHITHMKQITALTANNVIRLIMTIILFCFIMAICFSQNNCKLYQND